MFTLLPVVPELAVVPEAVSVPEDASVPAEEVEGPAEAGDPLFGTVNRGGVKPI